MIAAEGSGTSSVRELASEFPFDVARRGYAVSSAVLAAVLPAHDGLTAAAPVAMDDAGLELFIATSYITADVAEFLGLPRDRTVIMGSQIDV